MLIWTESFETTVGGTGLAAKTTPQGSFPSVGVSLVSSSPRTGVSCAGGGQYSVNLRGTDRDVTVIAGYAVLTSTGSTTVWSFMVFAGDTNGTTIHVVLQVNADGSISAIRGGGTVLGTSAPGVLSNGFFAYKYVEAKVTLSDTVGVVVVKVDDAIVLNLSGVDTKNGGTTALIDYVRYDCSSFVRIDDVYLCNGQGSSNTDFLGPVHILAKVPTGNGATSNGVGSDGNSVDNYALVDEALASVQSAWATDYVDLVNTGDEDTYAYDDITEFGGGSVVKGVMVWTHAQKNDAGARSLTPRARLSGVESSGAPMNTLVNGTFNTYGVAIETKPGGGAWTVADVNSAEFGAQAS